MKGLLFFTLMLLFLNCSTRQKINKIPILFDQEAQQAGFNVFYIPVKIDHIKKEFRMQFDLGLDVSAIYGNSLNSILKRYPDMESKISARKDYKLLKTHYSLAGYKSTLDSLFIFDNYGSDNDFHEQEIIGSIGVNQFKNKILLINYKELFIRILEKENQIDKDQFDFTPMNITGNNKIIITLQAGNDSEKFLFDTGNGVPLATINREFYEKQTENQRESRDTIHGNSWGETVYLYGAKQQKAIGTKNVILPIHDNRLYYTESKRIAELYKEIQVEHSIGNNFFMDKTILFDFKNNQFGIKK